MKLRKKLILWAMVGGIVLCVGIPTVLIGQQLRQDSLDHALIQAVKKLDAPAVTRLLDQGASANARDTGGSPTFQKLLAQLVARFQYGSGRNTSHQGSSALQLLMYDLRCVNPRNRATFDGMEAALIRHGADIHVYGNLGNRNIDETPLFYAALWGLHRTVELLIARGADVNARDAKGRTPLMDADAYSANLLLQYGADVDARDKHQKTALFYPLRVDRAKVLIEHGANVNLADDQGLSILYHTQIDGHYSGQGAIIQLLKQHGARLNSKDQRWIAIDQKYEREWGHPVPH